jgi:hypothetical protein
MVPELSRLTPIVLALVILALAGVAVPSGLGQPARAEPQLLPVSPTAPADGAVIGADSNSLHVKLDWSIPQEPVPVRYFVEVVAIEKDRPREVFAAYVDHPPVDVTVADGTAEYAWRVYTVGRDVAAYVLSGWERFSLKLQR